VGFAQAVFVLAALGRVLRDLGEAALVPAFGLCRIAVLDEWGDRYLSGGLYTF
jgi:hypothetical protein